MNKKNTIFFLLSALFLSSCQLFDHDITVDKNELVMHSKEKHQIKAESYSEIEYDTKDSYHAFVSSEGVITANNIGETIVTADNGYKTAEISVKVEPVYHLYTEPIPNFGQKLEDFIAEHGDGNFVLEDSIHLFINASGNITATGYMFSDDKLCGMCYFLNETKEDAFNFLDERYFNIAAFDNSEFFIDAMAIGKAYRCVCLTDRFNTFPVPNLNLGCCVIYSTATYMRQYLGKSN